MQPADRVRRFRLRRGRRRQARLIVPCPPLGITFRQARRRVVRAREDGGKAAIDRQLRQMLGDDEFERFREAVDGPREATDADR